MKKYFALALIVVFPLVTFAAPFAGIKDMIKAIIDILAQLRGLAVGLALLYFFWGIATYIRAAGDEKALEKGKNIMIWGVVALFVMTSVAGLVTFMQRQLGISGGGVLQIVAPTSGQGGSSGGGSSSGSNSSNPSSAPFGSSNNGYTTPCGIDSASGEPCPSGPVGSTPGGDQPTNRWDDCGPDSFFETVCEN